MLSVRAPNINFKIQQLPQPWLKALKENGNNLLQLKIIVPTIVKWMHPPTGLPQLLTQKPELFGMALLCDGWATTLRRLGDEPAGQSSTSPSRFTQNGCATAGRRLCDEPAGQSSTSPSRFAQNGCAMAVRRLCDEPAGQSMHPSTGRFKLNVDGAFKSATGIAGGGGILRDHNGDCIFAFAANYQRTTAALDAEARALRDGLAMCCTKGFLEIVVETDSLALTQSVTGQALRPWELTCIFQEMVAPSHLLTTKITQVPREANQTAHYLVSYGCSIDQIDFWESEAVLPHTVKGPYRLDKVGCPTLRT
ncbi:hypothetical protein Taro_053968 [Colocasia esculenta]|uniref:RNase H type-1 domain-containing protein n=1 Tax=Colocasia esculenta TaxID=4460 RepID=A0A843XMB9_COLES|nr:hypothetical protein [Colocasia esculenta]